MLSKARREYKRKRREEELSQRLKKLREKQKKTATQDFLMGDDDE